MDQPVCYGGRRTLVVPFQAPCISARVQWPCWAGGAAVQPEEEEEQLELGRQPGECLSGQLRDRQHPQFFTVHISMCKN